MCYSTQIGKSKAQLSARFKASFGNAEAANALMSEIHNTKKRMPVILSSLSEKDWLQGGDLLMQNDRLQAVVV